MTIYKGNNLIQQVYLGTNEITSTYLNNQIIFEPDVTNWVNVLPEILTNSNVTFTNINTGVGDYDNRAQLLANTDSYLMIFAYSGTTQQIGITLLDSDDIWLLSGDYRCTVYMIHRTTRNYASSIQFGTGIDADYFGRIDITPPQEGTGNDLYNISYEFSAISFPGNSFRVMIDINTTPGDNFCIRKVVLERKS